MKKIIIAVIALTSISNCLFGQGFYLRLGIGYAFPLAGQSMYDTPIPFNGFPTGYNGSRNNSGITQTYNINGASFSSGLQSALSVGYLFNENVGFQLDAGIGMSMKKYSFTDNNANVNIGSGTTLPYAIVTTQQANTPVILMPSLILQTGDTWKIYSRFGLAIPLITKITQEQSLTNEPGNGAQVTDDFSWQIKSGFSLGFTAAAGLKYKLNDKVSIWGELNLLSLSLNPKEQDLQTWTETQAGASQSVPLSNYGNAAVIKFSKTATVDSNLTSLPAYSIPFSNIGFQFGLTFNLSGERSSGHRRANEDIDPNRPFRRR